MINIVLVGGAKRITLVQQISDIVGSINEEVSFISVERDLGFYPISKYAQVMEGPSFQDEKFSLYLKNLVNTYSSLPIACMDAALPFISELRGRIYENVQVIAHTTTAAELCLDKRLTEKFCQESGIQTPATYLPNQAMNDDVIIKPAKGFGGRGIIICAVDNHKVVPDYGPDYIYQKMIIGQETTHDLYISKGGEFIASSRDRLAVVDGEVDHCVVREPHNLEMEIFRKIVNTGLFWGPITVQTIATQTGECILIEINARLGGGVTASIAAGIPIIEKYLEEAFGIKFPVRQIRKLEMKRARNDFYRFID